MLVKNLKTTLVSEINELKSIKSSHIYEAIAKAFGYKSYAAFCASDIIMTCKSTWDNFNVSIFIMNLGISHETATKIQNIVQLFKDNSIPIYADIDMVKAQLNKVKKRSQRHVYLNDDFSEIFLFIIYSEWKKSRTSLESVEKIRTGKQYKKQFSKAEQYLINQALDEIIKRLQSGMTLNQATIGYMSPYMQILTLDPALMKKFINHELSYVDDNGCVFSYINCVKNNPFYDVDFNFSLLLNIFKSLVDQLYGIETLKVTLKSFTNNNLPYDSVMFNILANIIDMVECGIDFNEIILEKYAPETHISILSILKTLNTIDSE